MTIIERLFVYAYTHLHNERDSVSIVDRIKKKVLIMSFSGIKNWLGVC